MPVVIEVDGATLLAGKQDPKLAVEIYIYALDSTGTIQDFLSQTVGLDLAKVESSLRQAGLKFFGHVELAPGTYSVRTLVRNGSTGATSLRVTPLTVPPAGQATLLPALFQEAPGRWVAVPETPKPGQQLPYPFMLEGKAVHPRLAAGAHPGEGRAARPGRLQPAAGGVEGPRPGDGGRRPGDAGRRLQGGRQGDRRRRRALPPARHLPAARRPAAGRLLAARHADRRRRQGGEQHQPVHGGERRGRPGGADADAAGQDDPARRPGRRAPRLRRRRRGVGPGAAGGRPSAFSGTAQVLSIDVPVQVVRDGEPVRGLQAADFQVWEGRRRLAVTGFESLDLAAPAAGGAVLVREKRPGCRPPPGAISSSSSISPSPSRSRSRGRGRRRPGCSPNCIRPTWWRWPPTARCAGRNWCSATPPTAGRSTTPSPPSASPT